MIYQPLRGTKLSSVQFKVGHGRFVSHIAFCGSRMFRGPANIHSPGRPRRDWRSGQFRNLEIYGQRLGEQIG